MLKHVPWMAEECLIKSTTTGNASQPVEMLDTADRTNSVIQACKNLEKCKFYCQMAILHPEDAHFEKSLTFLGCSMEMLRSSLAKWTEKNETVDENVWKPELDDSICSSPIHFRASADLQECLRSRDSISHFWSAMCRCAFCGSSKITSRTTCRPMEFHRIVRGDCSMCPFLSFRNHGS